MKKIILGLATLFLLTSCSQDKASEKLKDQVIEIRAGVGIVTGSGDFGELGPKDSKVLTFKITNSGDAPLVGPPSIDNSDFQIIYQQSSCSSIAPKKYCSLKVAFDAKGKTPGQSYSANLNLDSAFVALTGSVQAPAPIAQAPEGEELLPIPKYMSGSAEISSLDFGAITAKQSVLKSFTIKNMGALTTNSAVSLSNSNFSISYDTCSNKPLAPGKSCSLKVSLSGAGKSGDVASSLIYEGVSLSLIGNVTAPSTPSGEGSSGAMANVVFLYEGEQLVSPPSINAGNLVGNDAKQLIVYAKNIGNLSTVSQTASLDNPNFSLLYNQCQNKILAPNGSCQMRIIFSASGKAENIYASTLSFGDKSIALSAQVGALSCGLNEHAESGACVCDEGFTGTAGNCVAISPAPTTIMARQLIPFKDPAEASNTSIRQVYLKTPKIMYSVSAQRAMPYKQIILKSEEDAQGNLQHENVYETFQVVTNYNDESHLSLIPEYKLFNKPIGNFLYYQEKQTTSSYKILKLNLDTDQVEVIFQNLPMQAINSVDLTAMVVYTGSSSTAALRNPDGSIYADLSPIGLYSKGMTQFNSASWGYLSNYVVFHGGKMYMEGRYACATNRTQTLYSCDLNEASPNSCSSSTEPFVKHLIADIKDPNSTLSGGITCSSGFGSVRMVGNKIFFQAYSISANYLAMYSYDLNNQQINVEAYNSRYLDSNGQYTTYNGGNFHSYLQTNYDNFLYQGYPPIFKETKKLANGYTVTEHKVWLINPVTGTKELLESYTPVTEVSEEVMSSSSYYLDDLVATTTDSSPLYVKTSQDNSSMVYVRKSKSSSEVISGYYYNDPMMYEYRIVPYKKEIVAYDYATGNKKISSEYVINNQSTVYKHGYQQYWIQALVTSFSFNPNTNQESIELVSGPIISFESTPVSIKRSAEQMKGLIGTPSLIFNNSDLFQAAHSLDQHITNSNLSYEPRIISVNPVEMASELNFVDDTKNSISVNATITTNNTYVTLNGSKLDTKEPYSLDFSLSNPSVQVTNKSSSLDSSLVRQQGQFNFSQWDGNPIQINFNYLTNYSNRNKSFTVSVNATCGSGASYDSTNKACICSDNSKYYSYSSCSNKCTDGTWNSTTNTCDCTTAGWTYQQGSGPNGMGGYCKDPNSCPNPWEIYDEYQCMNCGYYWDWMMWSCM